MKNPASRYAACMAFLVAALGAPPVLAQQDDLDFFVIVKSNNWDQDEETGELKLLNYHFFSEIFMTENGQVTDAAFVRPGVDKIHAYDPYGKGKIFMEGGHFDSQEEVDAAWPNGDYSITIETPSGTIKDYRLTLAGPDGKSQIPAGITITPHQDGKPVPPLALDPDKALTMKWTPFAVGAADPNGLVDDLIFFVIADCHGERIVHTGLPSDEIYLTYEATEFSVPADKLRPGEGYSTFVEFPNQVMTEKVQGVLAFSSYATTTYLDLKTTGEASGPACPDKLKPMDSGQTDR